MLLGCVDLQLPCQFLFTSRLNAAVDALRCLRNSVSIGFPIYPEFRIRRSSAALGEPSAFGFRKNMPKKTTL